MGRATEFASILLLIALSLQRTLPISSFSHITRDFEDSAAPRNLKQERDHAHEVHCSRERSRAAWQIIEEYLLPFLEREQYQLSSSCKLHPDNDLFRDQEQHKIHVDINEWRCGYCKKSFKAEKFLDQHFDNRHNGLLNVDKKRCPVCDYAVPLSTANCSKSDGKCIADLCGALHCDLVMNSRVSKAKCNPAAAARNRHLCEALADSCFPINRGLSASRLHEIFLHQFCDAHTCSGGGKPFSRGGLKQPSVLYLAISILTLMMLPVFYLIVYLYQSEMRKGTQELKRISSHGLKAKPS